MASNTATATLTYIDMEVPPDQVPVTWYVGMRTSPEGLPVGTEQSFPMPTPTATFLNVAPGTYEFWAGQRTSGGGETGEVKKSDPFTVTAPNVVVKLVGTITATVG